MGLEWDDFLQHITWRIGSGIMRDFGIICDIHELFIEKNNYLLKSYILNVKYISSNKNLLF